MKLSKLLLLILFLCAISCKPKVTVPREPDAMLKERFDSVSRELNIAKDSIIYLNNSLELEKQKYEVTVSNLNSCDSTNAVLRSDLFVANYKLGRIKEYCNIVKRDNTHLKFLRGWINRVLED
jgi:hypothetical protein